MSKLREFWDAFAEFLETANITPVVVLVSVAHYGEVLVVDNMVVAYCIGAFIDLLHYRTVNHAVNKPSWLNALIGLSTTIMATGYHLRFYENDWLLALPIPVGIAIMAYYNSQGADYSPAKLKQQLSVLRGKLTRAENKLAHVDRLQAKLDNAVTMGRKLLAERDDAVAQLDKAKQDADKAVAKYASLKKLLDNLSDEAAYVVNSQSNGGFDVEQLVKRGVSKSAAARVPAALNLRIKQL